MYIKISVEDELPPISEPVFCFGHAGHKMVCYRSHFDSGDFRRTHNNRRTVGITHWLKFVLENE